MPSYLAARSSSCFFRARLLLRNSSTLALSTALHVLTVALLLALPFLLPLGRIYLVGVAATAALLMYEHRLVRPDDLSRVNQAFFTVNGCVSFLILAATAVDRAAH